MTDKKELDPTGRGYLLAMKKQFVHENCDRASLVELVDRAWDAALKAEAERREKEMSDIPANKLDRDLSDVKERGVMTSLVSALQILKGLRDHVSTVYESQVDVVYDIVLNATGYIR
jgi:hypothetical protein